MLYAEPIFAGKYDYQGTGFVEGMNGASAVYSRFTDEIYYPLYAGAHLDERMRIVPEDYNVDGKYFVLMVLYFDVNKTDHLDKCWSLYDGAYHEMDVELSDHPDYANGYKAGSHNVMLSSHHNPPIDTCEPYAFICKTHSGDLLRLPEDKRYYFGTEWLDWEWSDYKGDWNLYCRENHYFNNGQQWIVNGDPKLDKCDIWYYQNTTFSECIGCPKIPQLDCWQDCIYSNFDPTICSICNTVTGASYGNEYCAPGWTASPTNKPTKTPTMSPNSKTSNPTNDPVIDPTKSPSPNPTSQPSLSPTLKPSKSPLRPGETSHPTIHPTSEPTDFPTIYPTFAPSIWSEIQTQTDSTLLPTILPSIANPVGESEVEDTGSSFLGTTMGIFTTVVGALVVCIIVSSCLYCYIRSRRYRRGRPSMDTDRWQPKIYQTNDRVHKASIIDEPAQRKQSIVRTGSYDKADQVTDTNLLPVPAQQDEVTQPSCPINTTTSYGVVNEIVQQHKESLNTNGTLNAENVIAAEEDDQEYEYYEDENGEYEYYYEEEEEDGDGNEAGGDEQYYEYYEE